MKNHSKPKVALSTTSTEWGDTPAHSIRKVDLARSHQPQWDLPVFKSRPKPLSMVAKCLLVTSTKIIFLKQPVKEVFRVKSPFKSVRGCKESIKLSRVKRVRLRRALWFQGRVWAVTIFFTRYVTWICPGTRTWIGSFHSSRQLLNVHKPRQRVSKNGVNSSGKSSLSLACITTAKSAKLQKVLQTPIPALASETSLSKREEAKTALRKTIKQFCQVSIEAFTKLMRQLMSDPKLDDNNKKAEQAKVFHLPTRPTLLAVRKVTLKSKQWSSGLKA